MNYQQINSIKFWAEEDRPREKLLDKGRHVLSEAELIAILIGSGNKEDSAVELSKKILASANNDLNLLAKLSVHDLMKFNGVGQAKAISIVAALELGRRRKDTDSSKKVKITGSRDVYSIMKPIMLDLPHEEFWMLLLNRANFVIKKELISKGGIAGTVVDTKLIFNSALSHFASAIIICHNHPSGNLKPSNADRSITKKIKEAGQLLDIALLDHIIISDNDFYSFADETIL